VAGAGPRDRVDPLPAGGRLQPAGSVGSGNTTHRVALTAPSDVDDEVAGWLRTAYERAG
jgi:hypothetical protein